MPYSHRKEIVRKFFYATGVNVNNIILIVQTSATVLFFYCVNLYHEKNKNATCFTKKKIQHSKSTMLETLNTPAL